MPAPIGKPWLKREEILASIQKRILSPLMSWRKRFPQAFLVGCGVAGLYLVWVVYVSPWMAIRETHRDWRTLKVQVADGQRVVGPMIRGEIPPLGVSGDLPRILDGLNALAHRHRIQLLHLAPGSPRPGEPKGLVVLPIEISLEGEYRPIGEFLGAITLDPSLGSLFIRRLTIDRQVRLLPRLKTSVSLKLFLSE